MMPANRRDRAGVALGFFAFIAAPILLYWLLS